MARHRKLEVILKVVERCNINCTYCYFFNGADRSYREHSPIIAAETIAATASFLRNGVVSLGLKSLQLDFHGGEPLLMKRQLFAEMCEHFRAVLAPVCDVQFCVQTNAIPINDDWIDLFTWYDVRASTSLDGPADYHDRDRVDFAGGGTHTRTMAGIHRLRDAVRAGRLKGFGALCVINPLHSPTRIYRYFVDELGLDAFDFLLPLMTHDSFAGPPPSAYGNFLCDLFDAWAADDDPRIQVRILNSVLSLLLGGPSRVTGFGLELPLAITVASDGSLAPDDTLRACGTDAIRSNLTVFDTSLDSFLDSSLMRRLEDAHSNLAATCRACCWQTVCGGGQLVHRYALHRGFDNPSVFCEGLQPFFARVAAYLTNRGLPLGRLSEVLLGSQLALDTATAPRRRMETSGRTSAGRTRSVPEMNPSRREQTERLIN